MIARRPILASVCAVVTAAVLALAGCGGSSGSGAASTAPARAAAGTPSIFVANRVPGGVLDVVRCDLTDPASEANPYPVSCSRTDRTGSDVQALLATTQGLYEGLASGAMRRCSTDGTGCADLNTFGSGVRSLATDGTRIYAGTSAGTVLSCDATQADRCSDLRTGPGSVNGLAVTDGSLFAALGTENVLIKCDLTAGTCARHASLPGSASAITVSGDRLIVSTMYDLVSCDPATANACVTHPRTTSQILDVTAGGGNVYVARGGARDFLQQCDADATNCVRRKTGSTRITGNAVAVQSGRVFLGSAILWSCKAASVAPCVGTRGLPTGFRSVDLVVAGTPAG